MVNYHRLYLQSSMKMNRFLGTVLISLWGMDIMTFSSFFRLNSSSLSQLCCFVICLSLGYSKYHLVIVNVPVGSHKAEVWSAEFDHIWTYEVLLDCSHPWQTQRLLLSHPPFSPARYELQTTLSFSGLWQSGKGHAFRSCSFVQCYHSS